MGRGGGRCRAGTRGGARTADAVLSQLVHYRDRLWRSGEGRAAGPTIGLCRRLSEPSVAFAPHSPATPALYFPVSETRAHGSHVACLKLQPEAEVGFKPRSTHCYAKPRSFPHTGRLSTPSHLPASPLKSELHNPSGSHEGHVTSLGLGFRMCAVGHMLPANND